MKKHNADESQLYRLLERLMQKPCTTIEARHELHILNAASRVYELRHKLGLNIQTRRISAISPGGKSHRVAQYVLLREI